MSVIAKPTAEEVGRSLGLPALTEDQEQLIGDAIADAQADVELALGRPIVPAQKTLTRRSPLLGGDLTDPKTWRLLEEFDDKTTVVSATPLTGADDGLYDLVVKVGLDGAGTRPIVRFIKAHAAASLRANPDLKIGTRTVQSVSADGQSISYATNSTADGTAGAPPSLAELKRQYGKRAVFRRALPTPPVFPYSDLNGR